MKVIGIVKTIFPIIMIGLMLSNFSLKNEILTELEITPISNYNDYKKGYVQTLKRHHPDKNENSDLYIYFQTLNENYFKNVSYYIKNIKELYYLGNLPHKNEETMEDEITLQRYQMFFYFVFKFLMVQLFLLIIIFRLDKNIKILFTILFMIFFSILQMNILFNQILFLLKERNFFYISILINKYTSNFLNHDILKFSTCKEILNFYCLVQSCIIIVLVLFFNYLKKKNVFEDFSYKVTFVFCLKEISKLKTITDKNERLIILKKLSVACNEIIPKDNFLMTYIKKIVKFLCLLLFLYSVFGR